MKRPFRDCFWTYSRKGWVPRWWNRLGVPEVQACGDEWGYHCVVWGTMFTGYVVFAWWRCRCWDCVSTRMVMEAREIYGDEIADRVDQYIDRIRLLDLSIR